MFDLSKYAKFISITHNYDNQFNHELIKCPIFKHNKNLWSKKNAHINDAAKSNKFIKKF